MWEAFHITIPQLERKIKILEKRIIELEIDEPQNGFVLKAQKIAPKGD